MLNRLCLVIEQLHGDSTVIVLSTPSLYIGNGNSQLYDTGNVALIDCAHGPSAGALHEASVCMAVVVTGLMHSSCIHVLGWCLCFRWYPPRAHSMQHVCLLHAGAARNG